MMENIARVPPGYNWENSVPAKGGVRWFVRPSLEKATDSKKKQIQIRSTSQLVLLHKENCFTDLKPEHLSKSKARIQEKEQVEQEQEQQVEEQLDEEEQLEEQGTVDSAKKRALDARKSKEMNDKRARLDTYGKQFDQRFVATPNNNRFVAATRVLWTIMKLILNNKLNLCMTFS